MRTQSLGLLSLCALLLSGCAIHPEPMPDADVQQRVEADQKLFFANMEAPSAPITLYEAMARALKYNLEQRIKLLEEELSQGTFQHSLYALLPQLNTSVSHASRSNYAASWSEDLHTGAQSLEMSKSQEKSRLMADGALVWNLLDFGVSYAQAQQQADQTLIAKERRRRARQDIIRDVQQAYWQAIAADTMHNRVVELLGKAEDALKKSEAMEKQKLQPLDKALEYQQSLLERINLLVALRKNLDMARIRLATLINLPPGSSFKLDLAGRNRMEQTNKIPDPALLTAVALQQRPELREEDYQKRISELEIRKAMLRMLPGIEVSFDRQYDSNKYLNDNAWSDAAFKISYNILNLFSVPVAIENAKMQKGVAEARRLALGMAVVSQVHLATQRYGHSLKEFSVAQQIFQVQERRSKLAKSAKEAEAGNALESIKQEVSELLAEMQRDFAYAELEGAMGVILHTIGQDPLSDATEGQSLADMAQTLANSWRLESISLPAVPPSAESPPQVTPPVASPPAQTSNTPPPLSSPPAEHSALPSAVGDKQEFVVHVTPFIAKGQVAAFQNRLTQLGLKSYVLTGQTAKHTPTYGLRLEPMDRQQAELTLLQIHKLNARLRGEILPAARYGA